MKFQAFLSNTNNFQTDLFDPQMGHKLELPLQVRVDLGLIAIKRWPHTPQRSKTEALASDAI